MPAINATLLAVNSAPDSAITHPQYPTQHGLGHGDIAAIILGIILGLCLLGKCLANLWTAWKLSSLL